MALVLRVIDELTEVMLTEMLAISGSVKRQLGASDDVKVRVSSNNNASGYLEEGRTIELYSDGLLIGSGEILKVDQGVLDEKKVINLSCRGKLDYLYDVLPNPTLIIENKTMIQALYEVLLHTVFTLGDISTMPDKDFTIEFLDLREEKTLLGQVEKILAMQELKFNATVDAEGQWYLNIGDFVYENVSTLFRSPASTYYSGLPDHFNIITKIDRKSSSEDVVYMVEALGGEFTDPGGFKRKLLLWDAWQNDNLLDRDPDYPIVELVPEQRYMVVDRNKAPYPGGVFYSGHRNAASWAGWFGNAVTSPYWTKGGISFKPVPGYLNRIEIPGQVANNFLTTFASDQVYIRLVDLGTVASWTYDYELGTELFRGALPGHEDGLPNNGTLVIDFSHLNLLMEWDRVYGVVCEFYVTYSTGTNDQFLTQYYSGVSSVATGMGYSLWNRAYYTETNWQNNDYYGVVKVVTDPGPGSPHRLYQSFQKWTEYAPKEESPVLADIKASGQAMYDRSVAYLMEGGSKKFTYNMSAMGKNLNLSIGQRVSVKANSQTAIADRVSGNTTVKNYTVDDVLAIDEYTLDVKDGKMTGKFKLVETSDREDGIISLYDKSTEPEQPEWEVYSFDEVTEIVLENVSLSLSAPDSELFDGTPALQVQFPYNRPTDRHKSDNISLPFSEDTGKVVRVEMVAKQDDDLEVGLICKVAVGQGWTIADTLNLDCYFIWR
jgi:hypothetical protein